jgi:hypothetical protein
LLVERVRRLTRPRMVLMPRPRRADDLVEIRDLRLPAEIFPRFDSIADKDCWIAWAAGTHHDRNLAPRDPADSVHHLTHRDAPGIAKIVGPVKGPSAFERLQRLHTRIRQIVDMDVVADAGAVGVS